MITDSCAAEDIPEHGASPRLGEIADTDRYESHLTTSVASQRHPTGCVSYLLRQSMETARKFPQVTQKKEISAVHESRVGVIQGWTSTSVGYLFSFL